MYVMLTQKLSKGFKKFKVGDALQNQEISSIGIKDCFKLKFA